MSRPTLFVLLIAAVALLSCGATEVEAYTEIYYVQGCSDSKPPRDTRNCFRDNHGEDSSGSASGDSVVLSLRGINLPAPAADGEVTVTLEEHVAVPPLQTDAPSKHRDESGGGGEWFAHENGYVPTAGGDSAPPRTLRCAHPTPSTSFPTQLMTCTLSSPPLVSETDGNSALNAVTRTPVWMDVVVRRRRRPLPSESLDEDTEARGAVVAVLRRAVQVYWPVDASAAAGSLDAPAHDQATNTALHPLERLYAAPGAEEPLWAELGIGGLRRELRQLFRRALLTRLPSLSNITDALGVQHVRGVILYGPPGNGKTLIARSLARLLGDAADISVVNAADVLSKYVGESEKNLHDIFAGLEVGTSVREEDAEFDEDTDDVVSDPADADAPPGRPKSGPGRPPAQDGKLHIIVFDEFDALFRRRGQSGDESSAKAVYDGITNSLLSLMDGMQDRNDILVIGLTNRLEMLDKALLRPGRFELLIEIPAPDRDARENVFFIHTERLRQAGMLAADVDLRALAGRSSGFSGSDIAGAVRSAVSSSLLRYRSLSFGSPDAPTFTVGQADLRRAVEEIAGSKINDGKTYMHELPSGGEDTGGGAGAGGGFYDSGARVAELASTVTQLTPLPGNESQLLYGVVVHLAGSRGTGRTTTARQLANLLSADYAHVQYVACRTLMERGDPTDALLAVRESFTEASRAASSVLVLDDLDALFSEGTTARERLAALADDFIYKRAGVRSAATRAGADDVSSPDAGALLPDDPASEAAADGDTPFATTPKRLLIVTSALSAFGAAESVRYDAYFTVRRLRRADVRGALVHYGVLSPDAAAAAAKSITRLYPPVVSFKSFLRLTSHAVRLALEMDRRQRGTESAVGDGPVPFPFPVWRSLNVSGAEHEGRQPEGAQRPTLQQLVGVETLRQATARAASLSQQQDPFAGWSFAGAEDAAEDTDEIL